MNIQMLKVLVALSCNKVDCISVSSFFSKYPKSTSTLNELKTLHNLGYITILYSDDDVEEIGVNKKAIDFFK